METLPKLLKQLGLNTTEAALYVAGLGLPRIGVHELVQETGLKRPTVYHSLETLMQKGLVAKSGTGRRLAFSMSDPKHLTQLLDQKIERLKQEKQQVNDLLPLLLQRVAAPSPEYIGVTHYEGIAGVKTVVEEALYCKSRRWEILAPRKNFFSEFDPAYATYFLDTRKQRKILARSIWEMHEAQDATRRPGGLRLQAEDVLQRNPRYLPAHLSGTFASVMILFDDKVAIITSYQHKTAILIQSPEIYRLAHMLFEGLWSVSTPPWIDKS